MKHSHVVVTTLCIMALVLLGAVLHLFRELFIPFALAVLLSVLLRPAVSRLRAKGVPLPLALLAVLGLLFATLLVLGVLLEVSAAPLVADLPRYQPKLESVASNAIAWLQGLMRKLGLRTEDFDANSILGATQVTADAVSSVLGSFLNYVGKAALILLFMLFMLAGEGSLGVKLRHAFSSERAARISGALAEIGSRVRSYLGIKVALGAVYGVVTWLALLILGVEFSGFWGFLAFLASFVPYAGSAVAVGVPFLFALLQFDTLGRPLAVLATLGIVSAVVGNVVSPKLMASRLNLSPLLVLTSMLFWGLIWGPWGVALSTPLAVTTVIVFESIDAMRPVAVLMRDRVESA